MNWLRENWFKLFITLILSLFLTGTAVFINHNIKQDRINYIAKRRAECYQIYLKERDQWNNVVGPEYDSNEDVCRIRYNNANPQNKDCGSISSDASEFLIRSWVDCNSNTFTKEF